jgi:hypothetical protein
LFQAATSESTYGMKSIRLQFYAKTIKPINNIKTILASLTSKKAFTSWKNISASKKVSHQKHMFGRMQIYSSGLLNNKFVFAFH